MDGADAMDGADERAEGAIVGLIRTTRDLEFIFLRRGVASDLRFTSDAEVRHEGEVVFPR